MSQTVKDALIDTARNAIGTNLVIMAALGLATAVALAMSLWDVGARAPVDLPILCVAVAFAMAMLAAFLRMRARASFIQRMTAQDLIGITQNTDKSLWLHFQNRRSFLSSPPDIAPAEIEAALPSLPAPPKNYARAAIVWAAFLAPLGVGLLLNATPIPAKISQIKSTRGTLELSGNAIVASKINVKIGKSPEYAILRIDDGSGNCLIYVEAAAIPAAAIERARHKPGIAMRVIVHSKRTKYQGVGNAMIDALIAESFELLESS